MVKLDDPKMREALDDEPELPRMSFGDHLDELRRRVIKSLLAIFICVFAVVPFKGTVQEIILGPYREQWRQGFEVWVAELQERNDAGEIDDESLGYLQFCIDRKDEIEAGVYRYPHLLMSKTGYPVPYSLYAIGGLEDILSFMWASLIFALVIASPIVVWQIWAFVGAGLYKRERGAFYRYFPFMIGLFAAGVWFGYAIALPYSLGFLIGLMDPALVGAIFSVGQFLTLLFMTTAAMGVVFQVPVVMIALQKVGLVRHKTLLKHWRTTILIIFCASALFSPPEPVSMFMMALPMMLLYGVGLILTWIGQKRERPADEVLPS